MVILSTHGANLDSWQDNILTFKIPQKLLYVPPGLTLHNSTLDTNNVPASVEWIIT